MKRRDFLYRTGLTAAGLTLSRRAPLAQSEPPRWRTFEITTQVQVLQPRGATRVWLPTPLAAAPYQHTMGDTYHPGGGTAVMIETNANEPDIIPQLIMMRAIHLRAPTRSRIKLEGTSSKK